MATLMSVMLTQLGADLDDGWTGTTTAAGNANKLTLVDDTLYEKVADWVNDGMIVYLPTGPTNSGGNPETRVVDSLATNTITVKSAFSALVASGQSYEVHRLFTRNQKLVALRQAAPLLCPEIHSVVRDLTSIVIANNKYEYDISSLGIFQNRPHQILLAQYPLKNIWVKNTAYSIGDYARPTTLAKFTGYIYICTTAGTSHTSTEPTWPTTVGGTVADGSGALVWTCQPDLDYANYPMVPQHDWDITPDGLLRLNSSYDTGYQLGIVGIKPLAFTSSGATETIALDSPFTLVLSAQAALFLCQQKVVSAGTQDVARWTALIQSWQAILADRKQRYWMKPPDGTLISGAGLTV